MRIGILGNGQLGAMLALAAQALGHQVYFFAPSASNTIAGLGESFVGAYSDMKALREFVEKYKLDLVTYEFENVSKSSLQKLSVQVPVYPSVSALSFSQDRLYEKEFFRGLGFKTADYSTIKNQDHLLETFAKLAQPCFLKTRRFGYDGKGQMLVHTRQDCQRGWELLSSHPGGLILEALVKFDRELSMICVGSQDGEKAFYPLIENHHKAGILDFSVAPAPDITSALEARSQELAARCIDQMSYVGTLAIEFFQVGNDLIVNEMAPRVHNSGHWTIEGAVTSQFTNHILAITGSPLGACEPRGHSTMLNFIGSIPRKTDELKQIPGTYFHPYGKEAKPQRKLGHLTVTLENKNEQALAVKQVRKLTAASSAC